MDRPYEMNPLMVHLHYVNRMSMRVVTAVPQLVLTSREDTGKAKGIFEKMVILWVNWTYHGSTALPSGVTTQQHREERWWFSESTEHPWEHCTAFGGNNTTSGGKIVILWVNWTSHGSTALSSGVTTQQHREERWWFSDSTEHPMEALHCLRGWQHNNIGRARKPSNKLCWISHHPQCCSESRRCCQHGNRIWRQDCCTSTYSGLTKALKQRGMEKYTSKFCDNFIKHVNVHWLSLQKAVERILKVSPLQALSRTYFLPEGLKERRFVQLNNGAIYELSLLFYQHSQLSTCSYKEMHAPQVYATSWTETQPVD